MLRKRVDKSPDPCYNKTIKRTKELQNMVTSYSRINFLTINDAHLFTDVLIKNNIMDFKCSDAHLSFWWNRSNCQLVVRNIDTQEIMTFEDVEMGDDLVRPILLAWMYTGWDKRD